MDENKWPGMMQPMRNNRMIANEGAQICCQLKRPWMVAPVMSSIGFWKLRIKNTAIDIEKSTTKKVSQKNMPKIFPVSAITGEGIEDLVNFLKDDKDLEKENNK